MENKLPIGTVVLLQGGRKRIMIIGFYCNDEKNPEKLYDYCGVLYPEGYVGVNNFLLFNHTQISKVYYLGLNDDENKEFKVNLESFLKKSKEN